MHISTRRVLLTLGCLVCALPLFAGQPLPPPIHVTLSPQHWTQIPLPARTISFTHHGDEIWACGEHELIAVSSDGGSTWQVRHLARSAEMVLAITFADDQVGYAWGTDRLMLRSIDGGMTWKRYGHSPGMILDARFNDPKNGLASSTNWFAITHDGGKNWRIRVIPDLQTEPYHRDDIQAILALDAQRAAVLFVAADEKHGQLLSSTDDGGGNWKTLRFPPQLHLQTLIRAGDAYGAYGCRNDGNGACNPVRLSSSDGQDWRAFRQAPPKLDACGRQGCLEGSHRALLWDHDTTM